MSHALFVAGLCFYNEDGPLYPLLPTDVIELVKRGHLVPPTADEISDKSKGDALSKGVAIAQTMWFMIQCISSRAEHLPVANLEVIVEVSNRAQSPIPLNPSCSALISSAIRPSSAPL